MGLVAWPELAYPTAGSRAPKRYRWSLGSKDCEARLALAASLEGVSGRGVAGAVLAGVPPGLTSFDGGCESEAGPIWNEGCCLGCEEIGATFSFRAGDGDRCGVMTSGGLMMGTTRSATFLGPSRERDAAGVSGGEWTAEPCGDASGEAAREVPLEAPTMKCLCGVDDPECICDYLVSMVGSVRGRWGGSSDLLLMPVLNRAGKPARRHDAVHALTGCYFGELYAAVATLSVPLG